MRKIDTIEEWCKKNNKSEFLNEILYRDFNEDSPIDLNKKIWWLCPKCGEIIGNYTFKERLAIKEIKCKRCIRTIQMTEDEEISYLCKILGTSRPEQYIYAYIKSIFPSAVRGKNLTGYYGGQNLIYLFQNLHWRLSMMDSIGIKKSMD